MRTLVVLCHPYRGSYCAHLFSEIVAHLAEHHEVDTLDLYAGEELPAVSVAGDLSRAEALVLVYPTWWSSLPAPLLQWIELQLDRNGLADVRRIVAVTTHGSGRLVNLLEGGVGRRLILGGVRRFAHPDARARFVALYGIDRAGPQRLDGFVEEARRKVTAALR